MKKFTSFLVMLFVSTLVFAQTAITSPDDLQSGKIYYIEWLLGQDGSNNLGGMLYVDVEGYNEQLWCTYVWSDSEGNQLLPDPTAVEQHFAFIKSGEHFYLYSVAAQKFVTWDNDGAWLTDVPKYYIGVSANTLGNAAYPWNIGFDGAKFIAPYPQTGYDYSGYLYCSGANPANQLYACQLYEVGTLENTEALEAELTAALETADGEKTAALEALQTLYYDVEDFINVTTGYTAEGGEKIELQVSDPSAANYIWCNEPEESEGPIEQLIDGITDNNNFFHSRWNGTAAAVHYLEVDLGAGNELDAFSFGYATRPPSGSNAIANDFPDKFTIQGSNDGQTYTDIAVIDKNLPQVQSTTWQSENITCSEEYRYIRFNVIAERIYFHMAEFWMNYPLGESANDAYLPYTKYIRELKALQEEADRVLSDNQSLKAADINALVEEINALMAMINSLVSGEEDPLTVEYIAEVESKYTQHSVGFPTEEAGAAFQALVDAAKANPTTQARLDLQAALNDYLKIDDVIMPENGKKYTLAFVTWSGRVNYLNYDEALPGIVMVQDTLTEAGLPYPETAAFTCADNGDGTYSFTTADGKYLDKPAYSGVANNSAGACIADAPVYFTIEKIHPNGAAPDATYEMLFGLVAFNFGGTYFAPNSSGTTYYTGSLPHFQGSWTSAMTIKEYTGDTGIEEIIVNDAVEGIYDLSGRRLESISGAGVYIVNGKKVLVK